MKTEMSYEGGKLKIHIYNCMDLGHLICLAQLRYAAQVDGVDIVLAVMCQAMEVMCSFRIRHCHL